MLSVWIVTTALLLYVAVAWMWSPSQRQLKEEYDEYELLYCNKSDAVSRIGVFINRLHFKIVCRRKEILFAILMAWIVVTLTLRWINNL